MGVSDAWYPIILEATHAWENFLTLLSSVPCSVIWGLLTSITLESLV